jgi:acetyl esterase
LSILISTFFAADGFAQSKHKCDETCKPSAAVKGMLSTYNRTAPLDKLSDKTIPVLRQGERIASVTNVSPIAMDRVTHLNINSNSHSIPVTVWTPKLKEDTQGTKPPVLIYYHGGGWVLGCAAFYDPIIRKLADALPAVVISPDYRLAPENPYPAATDDCYATLQWAVQHASEFGADPTKIILAGDSAGGNLATVTALKAKEQSGPKVAFQVLFYPSVDLADPNTASAKCFGKGYVLTTKAMKSFATFYAPKDTDLKSPYISPFQAPDLSGMPPALIVTAGCDPLLSEGEAYAKKLTEAGAKVTYHVEPNIFHGYLNFLNGNSAASSVAEQTLDYAAGVIKENMAQSKPRDQPEKAAEPEKSAVPEDPDKP